ncbi:MAG TPA: alpha/beta fold hydrolase [Gaiellaceae bacterium]|nr:alpha/beta fold hydrolase [Gaiellaceae bacterium]
MTRVLVLPSSLGTDRTLWDAQIDAFSGSFRVIRYELPGRSTMAELGEDAIRLLDEEGVERASWCGLSLGGMVGMWLGANAPERLDRLVLACTAARMPAPEIYRERAPLVREQGLEAIADAVVARWFTPAAPPELPQRFRRVLVTRDVEAYARCCEALALWDFRDELPRVAVPTLVLAGAADEATPADATDLLAARIPGSRHELLEGAPHLANVECPEAFTAAAFAHLEEVA